MSRAGLLVLVAVPLSVVAGLVFVNLILPLLRDPRAGSQRISGAPAVAMARVPESYRILYRVERPGERSPLVGSDQIWVRRPFESRTESREGSPPGGQLQSSQVTALGRFAVPASRGSEGLVLATGPLPAAGDLRFDIVLREALRTRALLRREVREIAGRRCQVYRAAGPVGSGDLKPAVSSEEYSDACVDEAGLVLEEVSVTGGEVSRRRLAVEVEEAPRLRSDMFRTGGVTVQLSKGGGSIRPVDPASRPPDRFWELPRPPRGFERRGRFAVVPPQPEILTDPSTSDQRIASVVDVWVSGPNLFLVDQGGTVGQKPAFAPDPGAEKVGLGELGEAEVILTLRVIEVRVLLANGRFVRVSGTLPKTTLMDAARSLSPVEGGALRYLDE